MLGFIFVIGFLTLFFLGWQGAVLLSLSIGGLCYFIKSKHKAKLLCCLGLGGLWAIIIIFWQDYLHLDDFVLNQVVVITGNVVSIPEHDTRKVCFLFLIESINHQPLWPARQVRLNWYRFKQKKQQVLKAGESWQFQVKLRAPFGLENFIGFNYRRWLYQHSIQATGLVIDRYGKKGINRKLSSSHVFNLQQYRQKIAWFLERIDLHNTALIKALVLGERAEVKRSVRNLLQQTGTAHLLAVSGLHIGLIVTFTFFLIRGVLLWAPGMSRKYKSSGYALFIAAIVSLLVALCYSALAGFSVATLRACLMTVCVLLAFLCRRVVPIWALYQYALVGVVILFPLSVLSIGFWLSFLSVGVLIFVCAGRLTQTKLQKYLKPQWALLIALAPLSLAYFFNMPLIGLLANLVAIPWVGFLVLPLLLFALRHLKCNTTLY